MSGRRTTAIGALMAALVWAGGAGGLASAAQMSGGMATLPPLSIVSPTEHARVANPVSVVLETTGDMSKLTMGGTMGDMGAGGSNVHLHIVVDGKVLMPAASQLANAGKNRYRYILAPLSPGAHTISVYWADDSTHHAVGPIHTVTCAVTG